MDVDPSTLFLYLTTICLSINHFCVLAFWHLDALSVQLMLMEVR